MYKNRMSRLLGISCIVALAMMLSSCGAHQHASRRVSKRPPTLQEPQAPTQAPVVTEGPRQELYHSVAPGETLWRISKMYDVDVEEIKRANGITNVHDVEIGTRLLIPKAASMRRVVTLYPSKKWKYIIIHHSATESGNAMEFNRAHLNKGWEGVGYDFVIDNGTSSKVSGQIETSPRWTKQTNGAHCKAGGMNECGIGICLVGNFSKDRVPKEQFDSLVYLVNKLKTYYKIPNRNILGHSQVKGAKTECPGKLFPWREFRSQL